MRPEWVQALNRSLLGAIGTDPSPGTKLRLPGSLPVRLHQVSPSEAAGGLHAVVKSILLSLGESDVDQARIESAQPWVTWRNSEPGYQRNSNDFDAGCKRGPTSGHTQYHPKEGDVVLWPLMAVENYETETDNMSLQGIVEKHEISLERCMTFGPRNSPHHKTLPPLYHTAISILLQY